MGVIKIWGFSHQGQVRSENEDCFLVNDDVQRGEARWDFDEGDYISDNKGILCAVADGLGGQKGGATASETVLKHIALRFNNDECSDEDSADKFIRKLLLECHNELIEIADNDESVSSMGTTIVGLYIRKDYGIVFYAGDSRLYCMRGNELIALTRDHSLENYFMDIIDDYKPSGKSGIITNCLGGGKEGVCTPQINKLTFVKGDILLLCSDGLTDMVNDESIEKLLAGSDDISVKGRRLVDEANSSGGRDNITVLLIKY